jgi:TolA-binding protein
MNHLDPATREKRDYENGMSRFYSMQLRDANKTIELLREKINQLQHVEQQKVADLQEKVTELKIKNQALKSKMEFMQMSPAMYATHNQFNSQPIPFPPLGSSHIGRLATSNQVHEGPAYPFDPTLSNLGP